MKRTAWMLGLLLAAGQPAGIAMAQSLAHADFMTDDHNMRMTKLIGMPVYNDHNEKIGQLEEILMPSANGQVSAVIAVDGKLIKVPLSRVHFMPDKLMMPLGGKAAIAAMPAYSYRYGGGG